MAAKRLHGTPAHAESPPVLGSNAASPALAVAKQQGWEFAHSLIAHSLICSAAVPTADVPSAAVPGAAVPSAALQTAAVSTCC